MSTTVLEPVIERLDTLESAIRSLPRITSDADPALYQINTRVWLSEKSVQLGRPATLDDVTDAELDALAEAGFDWIWFLGVWQTGVAGQKVSCANPEWRSEFRHTLVDFLESDICGSCFAIVDYSVQPCFGGDAALDRLRHRIHEHGMKLLLDFVPNHTGLDHPWIMSHPEFYVWSTEENLRCEPQNCVHVQTCRGPLVMAYGRDPYFPGWPDTLQLNYANQAVKQQMTRELQRIASKCDGVRCDMAMLILPDVFERTWGLRPEPFWPGAIRTVRSEHPNFLFMAEVYWDLEWTLQQQGFDYTYDKRLYDRLRDEHARPVRDHFYADKEFQLKSARFLENHDEPRAAGTFRPEVHPAAAVLTYLCPGLRFFHEGQLEGRTKKVSVHLQRRPKEEINPALGEFYARLLACLKQREIREGEWRLLECVPAWEGNWTSDCFVSFAWHCPGSLPLVAAVNFAANQSQCYLPLPFEELLGKSLSLKDLLNAVTYDRDGDDMARRGLFLDMPPWGYHVFKLARGTP
jgi:glycosidase